MECYYEGSGAPPCTPPPSIILMLLLNGSLGLNALRQSPALLSIAAYKLADVAESSTSNLPAQTKQNLFTVARTLRRAAAASGGCQNFYEEVTGDVGLDARDHMLLPPLEPPKRASWRRRHAIDASATRRSQSLSLGLGIGDMFGEDDDTHMRRKEPSLCPLQLLHPLAASAMGHKGQEQRIGRHLSGSEFNSSGLHYKNESLPKFNRLGVEHIYPTSPQSPSPILPQPPLNAGLAPTHHLKSQRVSTYPCRISPMYVEKQERFRALRNREEERCKENQQTQQMSIQQLAVASITAKPNEPLRRAAEHTFTRPRRTVTNDTHRGRLFSNLLKTDQSTNDLKTTNPMQDILALDYGILSNTLYGDRCLIPGDNGMWHYMDPGVSGGTASQPY